MCIFVSAIYSHGCTTLQIGFNLTNLSATLSRTIYTLTIRNQSTGDDYSWSDPDGLVVFTPHGTVDDTWGSEEFISFRTLDTVTGLCVKGLAKLVVKIIVYNTMDEVNEKRRHDLRIPETNLGLQRQVSYKAEFNQQDILINSRLQNGFSSVAMQNSSSKDSEHS